jgi:uncharacterized repeat protein (TIGR01451 family)
MDSLPSPFTNTINVTGTNAALPGELITATASVTVPVTGGPAFDLSKTASARFARSGDSITYTIALTNTGQITLTRVVISDALIAGCRFDDVVNLAVGNSFAQTCSSPVTADLTNTVVVTGYPFGSGPAISRTATAAVRFITPDIEVSKVADRGVIATGQAVTFTITITNSGNSDLSGVQAIDPLAPVCDRTVGSLPQTAPITSYTCVVSNLTAPLTNTVTVTGTPPVGEVVTDTAEATVEVIDAALEVVKTASAANIQPGEPVTFTISITNTGAISLEVTLADALAPACDGSFSLAPAASDATHTCVITPTDDLTNTVIATGLNAAYPEITVIAESSAVVNVINPAITVSKTPAFQYARSGEVVTFTIAITNSGDFGNLKPITVTDALAPACSVVLTNTFLSPGLSTLLPVCPMTVSADITNTVVVTGVPVDFSDNPIGSAVVTDSAQAVVDVITPSIQLTKLPLPRM